MESLHPKKEDKQQYTDLQSIRDSDFEKHLYDESLADLYPDIRSACTDNAFLIHETLISVWVFMRYKVVKESLNIFSPPTREKLVEFVRENMDDFVLTAKFERRNYSRFINPSKKILAEDIFFQFTDETYDPSKASMAHISQKTIRKFVGKLSDRQLEVLRYMLDNPQFAEESLEQHFGELGYADRSGLYRIIKTLRSKLSLSLWQNEN